MLADCLLAAALSAATVVEIATRSLNHRGLTLAAALLATALVAWRRRAPLAAISIVAVTSVAQQAAGGELIAANLAVPLLAYLILLYSLGAHADRRHSEIGLGVALAGAGAAQLLESPSVSDLAFTTITTVAPWLAGRALRDRRLLAALMRDRALELERQRDALARLAVAEERAQIARELHDVIAHSVSLMVVQAGAAEEVLDRDYRRAREPLRSIQETGRQSIAELGRVLAMLRHGEARPPVLTPQPGVASLDSLLDQVREAGLVVHLRVEGKAQMLPPGVDLTAYRVVQEALTNTLKHAGPTKAEVVVRYANRSIELEITDQGRNGSPGTESTDGSGTGHGLIGMRERVALYGGSFSAQADGRGYRIRVTLPTGPAPP
jgi:signal transduction histidine kinase